MIRDPTASPISTVIATGLKTDVALDTVAVPATYPACLWSSIRSGFGKYPLSGSHDEIGRNSESTMVVSGPGCSRVCSLSGGSRRRAARPRSAAGGRCSTGREPGRVRSGVPERNGPRPRTAGSARVCWRSGPPPMRGPPAPPTGRSPRAIVARGCEQHAEDVSVGQHRHAEDRHDALGGHRAVDRVRVRALRVLVPRGMKRLCPCRRRRQGHSGTDPIAISSGRGPSPRPRRT